jgi:hypothetical protein
VALAPTRSTIVALAMTVSLTPALSRFAGEGDEGSLRDVHVKLFPARYNFLHLSNTPDTARLQARRRLRIA